MFGKRLKKNHIFDAEIHFSYSGGRMRRYFIDGTFNGVLSALCTMMQVHILTKCSSKESAIKVAKQWAKLLVEGVEGVEEECW